MFDKVKVGGNVKHDKKDFNTLPKVSNLRSVIYTVYTVYYNIMS